MEEKTLIFWMENMLDEVDSLFTFYIFLILFYLKSDYYFK